MHIPDDTYNLEISGFQSDRLSMHQVDSPYLSIIVFVGQEIFVKLILLAYLIPTWLPWLLPFPLLWWLIQRLNRRYLRRHLSAAPLDFAHLLFYVPLPKLFQSAALSQTFQQLRRHQAVPTRHLDIHATLENSVRNMGLFTPVHFCAQQRPEYLVLVDRSVPGDQQAALVESLLARMQREEIVFSRWFFERDPRWCYAASDDFTPHALADLGGRYAGRRLLIFSAGHGFIDPRTGRAAEWLQQLAPWPQRVLLSLEPAGQWQYLQSLLSAEGLLVAPADEQGLQDFVAALQRDVPPRRTYPDHFPYPPLLVSGERRWLQRLAPSVAEQRALLRQLRAFLDPDGFRWLAACAVYPELHWPLTLYLGRESLDEKRLARLTSLPWLRRNYLPDWLRSALLDTLPWQQRRRLRREFFQLMAASWKKPGEHVAVDTSLALSDTVSVNEREGDTITMNFLQGKLGLPVPGVMRPDNPQQRRSVWRMAGELVLLTVVATIFHFGPWRDVLLDEFITNDGEQQEIGRLTITTVPDPVQLTIRHGENVVPERRETVGNGASLWLRTGGQEITAEADNHVWADYSLEIAVRDTVSLDINLIRLPEPDEDGDGVPDETPDQCPDTLAQVAVNDRGCPLDRDRDGVVDYQDNCPDNRATEISQGVDADGCPQDRDGDNIPDYRDKCPDTRADAADLVDAEGCIQAPALLNLEVYPPLARISLRPAAGGKPVAGMPFAGSASELKRIEELPPESARFLPLPMATYRNELPAGEWILRAEAEGFEPLEQRLKLQPGQALRQAFELRRPDGKLSLTVHTLPPEARVWVMNIRPVYHDGMLLKPGSYKLKVTHDGYEEWQETRQLDKDSLLEVTLTKLPTLTLKLTPKDAEVRFAEDEYVYQPGMSLPVGEYELKISASDYANKQETVKLETDTELEITLEKVSAEIPPPSVTSSDSSDERVRVDIARPSLPVSIPPPDEQKRRHIPRQNPPGFEGLTPLAGCAQGGNLRFRSHHEAIPNMPDDWLPGGPLGVIRTQNATIQAGLAAFHRGDFVSAVEGWEQSLSQVELAAKAQIELLSHLAAAYQNLVLWLGNS